MKIIIENNFICLVLFWKCYFPTKFSRFLDYFLSIQTNFIAENFKITITTTNFSRFLGYFLNATTTPPQQQQKSKSQREIGGLKARSSGAVRSAWCWIDVWFVAGSAFGSLSSFFLSLSLSFGSVSSFFLLQVEGNGLKVKWIYKTIFRSNEQNFGQTEIIFQKFYFP